MQTLAHRHKSFNFPFSICCMPHWYLVYLCLHCFFAVHPYECFIWLPIRVVVYFFFLVSFSLSFGFTCTFPISNGRYSIESGRQPHTHTKIWIEMKRKKIWEPNELNYYCFCIVRMSSYEIFFLVVWLTFRLFRVYWIKLKIIATFFFFFNLLFS